MKRIIPEGFKIFVFVTIFFVVFSFISDKDYHELIDIAAPIEYNCYQVEKQLLGGWHPDIPKEIIDQCRKLKEEKHHVTTT